MTAPILASLVLWSTLFVTFVANIFMQHIVLQMECGIRYKNEGVHGYILCMRIARQPCIDPLCISSVTRPGFALDPPGSALDPAESYSCTLRKALPLQSGRESSLASLSISGKTRKSIKAPPLDPPKGYHPLDSDTLKNDKDHSAGE